MMTGRSARHLSLLLFALLLAGHPSIAHAQASAPANSGPVRATDRTQPLPAGPFAPDIQPQAVWDGRKIAPFRTLDSPKMVTASEADFLDDSDYILGVSANGESRAYPTRFIWFHHAINDQIGRPDAGGQVPVVIT